MMNIKNDLEIDVNARGIVSAELAWAYRIVPFRLTDRKYELYIDKDSSSGKSANELEILFGKEIQLIPKESDVIERALSQYFVKENSGDLTTSNSKLDIASKDFVSILFQEARSLKSSDIHIETYEQKCRIRLRIDGKLIERMQLQKTEYPALINKIKIMAGLDISEKRLPQDG